MSLEREIDNAVRDHERWKINLNALIEKGTVSSAASKIDKDNVCAFGRWLYGSTIPKDARYDPNYIIVQFLHEKFHECAGKVVRLLAEGKKLEAAAMMAQDGEYAITSDKLVAAMTTWKQSVAAKIGQSHPLVLTAVIANTVHLRQNSDE